MTTDKISQTETGERALSREALLRKFGFAWRRRFGGQAARSWRDTVTHFKPEPWLLAVDHEKARTPIRLRGLPAASR